MGEGINSIAHKFNLFNIYILIFKYIFAKTKNTYYLLTNLSPERTFN